MAHVALYLRKSSRDDTGGLDAQERRGKAYAGQHWPGVSVEVYRESDRGASAVDGSAARPEFEKLMSAVDADQVVHVWANEQSRFTRSESEWHATAARLHTAGISHAHFHIGGIVECVSLPASIVAAVNAHETRTLRARVKAKLQDNATQGRPHGGGRFGYRRDAQTLRIDDAEAEIIRDAAGKVLAGHGVESIAADLYRQGVRGRYGGRPTGQAVETWLISATTGGMIQHQGQIIGPGNWEPILDEATWRAVRAKLAERHNGPTHPRKYVLTGGLAVCGGCGAGLRGGVRGNKTTRVSYLRCPAPARGGKACTGIRMDHLEQVVTDEVWSALDRPEFLTAIGQDSGERDRIVNDLTSIDSRRGELAALWADGSLKGPEWKTARGALDAREKALQADLAAIPAPLVNVDITEARSAWEYMTAEERREFLSIFIDRVRVMPFDGQRIPHGEWVERGRVRIEWRTL